MYVGSYFVRVCEYNACTLTRVYTASALKSPRGRPDNVRGTSGSDRTCIYVYKCYMLYVSVYMHSASSILLLLRTGYLYYIIIFEFIIRGERFE